MSAISSFLVLLLAASVSGKLMNVINNCPFTIWPGTQGNSGYESPSGGGFRLDQGASSQLYVVDDWAGRVWGRTQCDEGSGYCVTGDCGSRIQCNGAGGVPPVTLAEIKFNGAGNQDFYDISLVDGYNLPMQMRPVNGVPTGRPDSQFDCKTTGCTSDLNANCPSELAIQNNGYTVACMSACTKFNNDQYCCRGAYGTPETCKSSEWPVNYAAIFKQYCPSAYSYAYDDQMSTFTCRSDPGTSYDIVFCP